MSTQLDTKLTQLADCGKRIKELRQAADQGWSDDQRTEFDKVVDDYNRINTEVETIKEDEQRKVRSLEIEKMMESSESRTGDPLSHLPTVTIEGEDPEGELRITAPDRNLALRAWMARGVKDETINTPINRDDALAAAKKVKLDIDPANDKASLKMRGLSSAEYDLPYLNHGGIAHRQRTIQDINRAYEQRAMGSEQATAGAEHVPDEAMQMLERALLKFGNVRGLAQVFRTEGAGPLPIPQSDDTSQEGEIVDENSATNEQVVATSQLVLNKFQYSSKIIRIHQSLIWDPGVDSMGLAVDAAFERIARVQNKHFTVGAGTTEPEGVTLNAVDSGVALATANSPTYDEIVDIYAALEESYEGNATWMFARPVLAGLMKIRTATGENPLWQPSLVPGAPATILGRPYQVNSHMPVAATGSAKCIVFGDFSMYKIRDMRDAYMVRLVERYAEFNQQAIIVWSFSDGKLSLPGGGPPMVYAAGPAT